MTYFPVISEGWELSTETHAKERSGLQNTFFFLMYVCTYTLYM